MYGHFSMVGQQCLVIATGPCPSSVGIDCKKTVRTHECSKTMYFPYALSAGVTLTGTTPVIAAKQVFILSYLI